MMTKKLLSLALFAAFALAVTAQPAKGSWMLGGEAHFLADTKASDFQSWAVSPHVAYFLSDRFALGLGLGAQAAQNGEFYKVSGYWLSPFARYYLPLNNPKFAFSLEAGGEYYYGRINSLRTDEWQARLGGGLNIFVTPTLALELYLGAARDFPDVGPGKTKLNTRLGFQVLLPKQAPQERQPANSEALRRQTAMLGVSRDIYLNSSDARHEALALLMLSDRFAIGGGISSPATTVSTDEDGSARISEVTGLLPVLRYYPGANPARRLRPYAGAGSSFLWTSDTAASSAFNLAPFAETGLLYFLRPELALEGNFRYQINTRALRNAADGSELLFRLGFQYFIPTRQ